MKTLIKGRVRKLINEYFKGVGDIPVRLSVMGVVVNVIRVRSYKLLADNNYRVEFDITLEVTDGVRYISDNILVSLSKDILFGGDIRISLRSPHLERFFPSSCCSVDVVIKDVKVLRK